jgi:hypothetical protein
MAMTDHRNGSEDGHDATLALDFALDQGRVGARRLAEKTIGLKTIVTRVQGMQLPHSDRTFSLAAAIELAQSFDIG